jgi:hypothetical protein
MTETDDLFEFGDLDESDSLEIDLDELFGDLKMLSIDVASTGPSELTPEVASPAKGVPAAPVDQAANAPHPAQQAVAAQPEVQPQAPQPVAGQPPTGQPVYQQAAYQQPVYQQPVYQGQVIQPVAPLHPDQAYAQQGLAPPGQRLFGKYGLSKTHAGIGFAVIVTLANVAVTMNKTEPVYNDPTPNVEVVTNTGEKSPEEGEFNRLALQAQIDSLQAQLLNVATPVKPITGSFAEGEHPVFVQAASYIDEGLYPLARQRLYTLLAIVDNFQPNERDAIESKASYMLADSWRLEAEGLDQGDNK